MNSAESGLVASVSALDGRHGIGGARFNSISAGAHGGVKSYGRERSHLRCRAIDLDPSLLAEPETLAEMLLTELFEQNTPRELSVERDGTRYRLSLYEEELEIPQSPLSSDDVWVVSGGAAGVNFAAGMSGGIAYIYDPHNEFDPKCNTGMVELETVDDQESIAELLRMVELHQRYTQSDIAALLLDDWEKNLEKFVKVMPQDYKRVMTERREHNEEIESVIEVKDRKSERPGV